MIESLSFQPPYETLHRSERGRIVFFSLSLVNGYTQVRTLIIFSLAFSGFSCNEFVGLFTPLIVHDKQKAYTFIHSHSSVFDSESLAILLSFFGEVKRKEKEIGLSFSLHPRRASFSPSLSLFSRTVDHY